MASDNMNESLNHLGEWLISAHGVDLIAALMLAEGVLLSLRYFWTGRGIAPASLLPNLLAGLFLLLALRCALTGAGWIWIAAFLAAALPAHLLDVVKRWR